MLRKQLLSLLLALVLAAALVWGLERLFVLRYEVGDIYPPYSSLRADPLGTKVLAAALGELPNVDVQRNFKPLPKLRPLGPVTLVYAGVDHHAYWTDQELLAFDSLVADGSRAVFTFFPVEYPPSATQDERADARERKKKEEKTESGRSREKRKVAEDKKKAATPAKSATSGPEEKKAADDKKESKDKKPDEDEDERRENLIDFDTVAQRWGCKFGYLPEEKGKAFDRHAALIEPGGHLESDISWHSSLYFRDLKPSWKVLYMCGTMPVVIERKWGAGSIILVADSFLLSNEALRGERHPRLISRLFDGPPTIIFDEEHNNLRDDPGIVSLVRKYRLHGLVGGLVLLALLFVWKNAVRFIPAHASASAESDVIAGKESGEGFVNLLRRAIRPSAVFDVCVEEWRKAFAHKPRELARVAEIQAQLAARPSRERNPVAAYAAISRALTRKI